MSMELNKESVEQAGGDERAAFEQWLEQHMSHHFSPELDLAKYEDSGEYRYNPAADYWKAWQARAALAQPSQSQYEASFEEWLANELEGEDGQPVPAAVCDITLARRAFNHWPKLEQPAKVGGVRFSAGVSSRLVVEAAQRLYEFESTPEKEAERIERLQAFREQLDPLNLAPHAEAFNEAPDEALRPEQAEAERPEVVGYRSKESGMVYEQDYGLKNPEALTTVAECERIVGALRAERDGAIKLLGQSVWQKIQLLTQERDAALARVAELEGKLTDWVHEGFRLNEALAVAKAQHSVPDDDTILQIFADNAEHSEQGDEHGYCIVREQHAQAIARKLLAAAPVCRLSRSALTEAQMRRLYENSTETENERLGFEAFARLIRRAEAVHQIAAAPGKEVGHE
ncbi:TPA: hypothetical protein ACP31Y_004039 [Pseudomonas aeruginosa]